MSGIYYLKFVVRNISASGDTYSAHLDRLEFAVDETWSALPVGYGGLFGKLCVFHEDAHTFQIRARDTAGWAIAVVLIRKLLQQEKGTVRLDLIRDSEPHQVAYTAELVFEVGRLRIPPGSLSKASQTEVIQRNANSQTSQANVRSVECQAHDRSAPVAQKVAVSEAQTQTDDPSRMPLSNEQKRLLIALFALIVLKVQMKMEEMTSAKSSMLHAVRRSQTSFLAKTVVKICPRCSKTTKEEESKKQNELKGKLANVAKAYRAMSRPASSTSCRRRTKNEHPTDPEPHGIPRARPTRGTMAVPQQPTVPREAIPPIHHERVAVLPIMPTNDDVLLSDGDIVEQDDDLQELPSSAASSRSNKSLRKNYQLVAASRAKSTSSSSRSEASTSRTQSSSSSEESSESSNSSSQSGSAASTSKSSKSKSKHSTSSSISEAVPSNSSSKRSSVSSQAISPTSAYLKNLRQEVLNDRSTTKH